MTDLERFRAALVEIRDMNPDKDSEQGFTDEWGQADCFVKAQDIARLALFDLERESATDGAVLIRKPKEG